MKICFISHDFPPLLGGIAAHVDNLSRSIATRGHDVLVTTIRYRKSPPFHVRENKRWVYRFFVPNVRKIRGACFIMQAVPTLLLHVLRYGIFDVVHWHNFEPDTFIALFVPARRHIFTNHSSTFLELYAQRRKTLSMLLTARYADAIIGPSRELTEKSAIWFDNTHRITYHTISNGVYTDRFLPPKSIRDEVRREILTPLHLAAETLVIFCPRRLEPKNGVHVLLEAFVLVIQSCPKARLIIAGNDAIPDYARQVREQATVLGGAALFVGGIPNDAMIRYYQASDLVVLPSFLEATSIAGLEAMACGVPIVGTAVGGIPEIIDQGVTGLLVPPGDARRLAQAIISLLKDDFKRQQFGRAARDRVESQFSWSSVAERTESVYLKNC